MINTNNSQLMQFISIATLILSLLGFIFGENIVDKLSGPELNMSSTKVKINLPDKFINTYTNNDNDSVSSIPEYYRVVEIINEGSRSSKNLRLIINTDGDIYDYKIDSAEKISELKVIDGELIAELQRFSPNAKVFLELWINDSNNTFQVRYADDHSSGSLEKEQKNNENTFFEYGMIIISILSGGFLVYSRYYLSSKQKLKEANFENQELESRFDKFFESLEEEKLNDLEEKGLEEEKELKDLYKRMEEFVKKSSKH